MDSVSAAASSGCVLVAGGRRWRIEPADVLDVLSWPRITPVPLTPRGSAPALLGVFEWQGQVVPVVDIGGLSSAERERVVIVRAAVKGSETPLAVAASDVLPADNAVAAESLAIGELAAKLPRRDR